MARNAIDITVNATDKASGKIKSLGKTFDTLHSKAEKAIGAIGAIGAVGGAGLVAVAVAGAQMNSTLEQSEARWNTLLKSSEEAEKQMAWMMDFAKKTPFDYKSVDATATAMMGMGLGIKEVNKWLPTLGDASAVLGGGSETVQGLGRALAQMNAKGRVSAEEMTQLAERGVNAWGMLADGMGMTQAEVRKLSEDGKLLAKDALPLIYEGMKNTFGGGTQQLMKSTTGQAMLAQENFKTLAGTLTSGAFNWFGATVLPLVNSGLEKLTTIFEGGIIQGFQNLWNSSTKAKVVLIALAGIITGALIGALFALTPVIAGAVVAFAPFLAIGLAVAGLAFIIIKYWKPIKAFFVNTFGGLFQAFSEFFMGIWQLVQPILMKVVNFIMTKIGEFATFWSEHWGMIKQAFVNIWNFISGFISVALKVILAIFKFVFPAVKFIVLSVWESIKGLISGALTFIMGVIKVFAGLFTGNWSKMWEGIKDMFFGAIQFIWNYILLFFGAKILGILGKFAMKGLKWIVNFVKGAISKVTQFTNTVWSKFFGMIGKVLKGIGNWVMKMLGKLDDLVYKFLGKVANLSTDMALRMGKMWEGLKSLAKKGVQMMIDAIIGLGKSFLNAGKGLLNAFKDGVMKGLNKAKQAVKDGMAKIRDFLPFSPAKKGALSDLDKSGKSFFPTFAKGMLRGVSPMLKVAGKGMQMLSSELKRDAEGFALETFTGGKSRVTVTHEHKHSGSVEVKGDANKEAVDFTRNSLTQKTEDEFLSDFRRVSRSR